MGKCFSLRQHVRRDHAGVQRAGSRGHRHDPRDGGGRPSRSPGLLLGHGCTAAKVSDTQPRRRQRSRTRRFGQ